MNNFAVFILTHGRPDNVLTIETLRKQGYTGRIYLICDSEDTTIDKYIKNYGKDNVIVFDKHEVEVDTGDNLDSTKGVIYARNNCFKIAKDLGIKYYLELDDDYKTFEFRFLDGQKLKTFLTNKLDLIFEYMINFLNASGAITVAFAQGGDFIGGCNGGIFKKRISRKAMNSFFCDVDKSFQFYGRINEDTTMYTTLNNRGFLIFTIADLMLTQIQTQKQKGGMTGLYLDGGTFVKSFYSVLYQPQAVKIATMGDKHKRMHHFVNWNLCTPKILNERYKKK